MGVNLCRRETSKHTSIKQRIEAITDSKQPTTLMRFVGNHRHNMPKGIAYSLIDYCELVDCTGRCIREDKAGHIEHHHSPILERLGINAYADLSKAKALFKSA